MGSALAEKTCTPCRGGVSPLTSEEAEGYRAQAPDWTLMDDATRIERRFRFRDFGEAVAFVARAAELAEAEGHHPDITFGWGYAAQGTPHFGLTLGGMRESGGWLPGDGMNRTEPIMVLF